MKTMFKLIVVLALAVATFSQHTTVSAGSNFHFRNRVADALFSNFDGCVATDTFVFASEDIFQSTPGPAGASSGMFLSIFQVDYCTDPPTLLKDAFGFASLGDPDLQVTRKLTSATLGATVNVYDFVSDSNFDVFVDLAWIGNGPLIRENGHFQFQSPHCSFKTHFNRTFRSAVASGSVSDGATNFAPDPSSSAGLFSAKSGELVVGCN